MDLFLLPRERGEVESCTERYQQEEKLMGPNFELKGGKHDLEKLVSESSDVPFSS